MKGNLSIANHYDVIIIGAGMAGLACAKEFGGSNLKILLIERSEKFYDKTCAAGITRFDLTFIPKSYLFTEFQQILIQHRDLSFDTSLSGGIISSFDRKQYLIDTLNSLKKCSNITIVIPSGDFTILDNKSIMLSGQRISFNILVGADGSSSTVRKFLKLPSRKYALAIQYIVPASFKKFVVHLEDEITRYCWIFPYNKYTSIGCASSIDTVTPEKLRMHLDGWLKRRHIDISNATFQAAIINCDYQGYKFNNIYLAGDAAGITSVLTGKGIYHAQFMGTYIAQEILGKPTNKREFLKIIIKWKILDLMSKLADASMFRTYFFWIGTRCAKFEIMQRIFLILFS